MCQSFVQRTKKIVFSVNAAVAAQFKTGVAVSCSFFCCFFEGNIMLNHDACA